MKQSSILVVILALCYPIEPVEGLGEILQFPTTVSLDNYVSLTTPDLEGALTSFTICSWIRPRYVGTTYNRYWFSYAVPGVDNEIILSQKMQLVHLFAASLAGVIPVAADDVWSHQCLAWSLSSGTFTAYLNGEQVGSKATAADRSLKPGGTIILGQEQDAVGGGFNLNQTFGGELYNLNILDKKLSAEEVMDMYQSGRCRGLAAGLVENIAIGWEAFLDAPRSGGVRVVRGTCSHWELVRGLIAEDLLEHLMQYHDGNINTIQHHDGDIE